MLNIIIIIDHFQCSIQTVYAAQKDLQKILIIFLLELKAVIKKTVVSSWCLINYRIVRKLRAETFISSIKIAARITCLAAR